MLTAFYDILGYSLSCVCVLKLYSQCHCQALMQSAIYFISLWNYWLLLWVGIIQSVPCNCNHFVIYYCAPV
jgi:hypothetical protein